MRGRPVSEHGTLPWVVKRGRSADDAADARTRSAAAATTGPRRRFVLRELAAAATVPGELSAAVF